MNIRVTAVKDRNDNVYKLGLWVRDSTAGVGTLTFCEPGTLKFASLGHAITDVDTQEILSVKQGQIVKSQIIDVRQGLKGTPGELKGVFRTDEPIGTILKNCTYGIYGVFYKLEINDLYPEPIEVGRMNAVELGKATILTTVDSSGVKEFDCEIVKAVEQTAKADKGLVVHITDPQLLKQTGGIVQGMSGSPIIQNGRIIGAVTHVFINDPTYGYGIYIDWMLEELA
jgi:stage IV sporulation protein B